VAPSPLLSAVTSAVLLLLLDDDADDDGAPPPPLQSPASCALHCFRSKSMTGPSRSSAPVPQKKYATDASTQTSVPTFAKQSSGVSVILSEINLDLPRSDLLIERSLTLQGIGRREPFCLRTHVARYVYMCVNGFIKASTTTGDGRTYAALTQVVAQA
jgi:hypothetical protein